MVRLLCILHLSPVLASTSWFRICIRPNLNPEGRTHRPRLSSKSKNLNKIYHPFESVTQQTAESQTIPAVLPSYSIMDNPRIEQSPAISATVSENLEDIQQPKPGRGLSFKDLAPELLAMIFKYCNLESLLNDHQTFLIPPLIVALRPQVPQYHQALALLYQQSYIYTPCYATKAFTARFKYSRTLVRKIAIRVKLVPTLNEIYIQVLIDITELSYAETAPHTFCPIPNQLKALSKAHL